MNMAEAEMALAHDRMATENTQLWQERREFIDWVASQCGGPCDMRSLINHARRLVEHQLAQIRSELYEWQQALQHLKAQLAQREDQLLKAMTERNDWRAVARKEVAGAKQQAEFDHDIIVREQERSGLLEAQFNSLGEQLAREQAKVAELEKQVHTHCEANKALYAKNSQLESQLLQAREALVDSSFWLGEVSKCCCDLADWDQIDGDQIKHTLNKIHKALKSPSPTRWILFGDDALSEELRALISKAKEI